MGVVTLDFSGELMVVSQALPFLWFPAALFQLVLFLPFPLGPFFKLPVWGGVLFSDYCVHMLA